MWSSFCWCIPNHFHCNPTQTDHNCDHDHGDDDDHDEPHKQSQISALQSQHCQLLRPLPGTEHFQDDNKPKEATIPNQHIVEYYGTYFSAEDTTACIVVEFMACGDLQRWIDDKRPVSEDWLAVIAYEVRGMWPLVGSMHVFNFGLPLSTNACYCGFAPFSRSTARLHVLQRLLLTFTKKCANHNDRC